MMHHLQQAYILHRYPYQDSHFLLKIFTKEMGLVTCIAKYAKRRQSSWYTLLQSFQPLRLSLQGTGQVLTLRQVERCGENLNLVESALWAGFYLNELILSFLPAHDPHPVLFDAYSAGLVGIQVLEEIERALRIFEVTLFREVGVLSDFAFDETGEPLDMEAYYRLQPHHLPQRIDLLPGNLPNIFQGKELAAIDAQNFSDPRLLKMAKRFTRLQLDFYLPKEKLKTREVFAQIFQDL